MLMAIYTIKSIAYFFTNENILNIKLNVFMFKAYPRIFVQQFVALFPFFIFGFVSQKYVAAIVLIILRSMADYIIDLIKNNPDKFIAYMQKHDKSLKDSEEGVNELKKYLQDMGA